MSNFQYAGQDDILLALNAANGTSFLKTDLAWSNPKVVAGTWRGNTSDRNTAVQLKAAAAAYQGTQVILYNRLDLAQLANLPGIALKLPASLAGVWAALPIIKYYTGINFAQGDLQNLALTYANDGSGSGSVQLSADPNSLGWQGSVTLPFVAGGNPIDTSAPNTSMAGLNYPVPDASATPGTAVYGPAYLYPYDFSDYTSTLVNYTAGTLTQTQADYLVAALKAKDIGTGATLWNDDTVTGNADYKLWNLTGAQIVSNGLNSVAMPTNQLFKYVMVLQLRADVTTPSGVLYLHYNDPFDPNNF